MSTGSRPGTCWYSMRPGSDSLRRRLGRIRLSCLGMKLLRAVAAAAIETKPLRSRNPLVPTLVVLFFHGRHLLVAGVILTEKRLRFIRSPLSIPVRHHIRIDTRIATSLSIRHPRMKAIASRPDKPLLHMRSSTNAQLGRKITQSAA